MFYTTAPLNFYFSAERRFDDWVIRPSTSVASLFFGAREKRTIWLLLVVKSNSNFYIRNSINIPSSTGEFVFNIWRREMRLKKEFFCKHDDEEFNDALHKT